MPCKFTTTECSSSWPRSVVRTAPDLAQVTDFSRGTFEFRNEPVLLVFGSRSCFYLRKTGLVAMVLDPHQACNCNSRARAKSKASVSRSAQGVEMPMVVCEHVEDSIALGKHHDRRAREANFKVSIAPQSFCSFGSLGVLL